MFPTLGPFVTTPQGSRLTAIRSRTRGHQNLRYAGRTARIIPERQLHRYMNRFRGGRANEGDRGR